MSWSLFSRSGQSVDPDTVEFEDFEPAVGANACTVVDVREPHEFAAGHIPNAVDMPLSRFDPQELPTGKPVVLVCQAGGRSKNALNRARAIGQGGREALCRRNGRLAFARRRRDCLTVALYTFV